MSEWGSYTANSSSSAFASFRSRVSKPSMDKLRGIGCGRADRSDSNHRTRVSGGVALRRSSIHMTRGSSAKSNTGDKTNVRRNSPTAPCIPFH